MEDPLLFINRIFSSLLSRIEFDERGNIIERRYLVDTLNNMKIEIYPNEHTPPHFHVVSPDFRASFSVIDCSILDGTIDSRSLKKVKYFYQIARPKIIEAWNKMRPSDCPVGPIETDQ